MSTFSPIAIQHPEFFGIITFIDRDAVYRLHWSDRVANTWTEFFPSLDMALGRLALLVNAAETARTFKGDEFDFGTSWETFTSENVS